VGKGMEILNFEFLILNCGLFRLRFTKRRRLQIGNGVGVAGK